MLACDFAGHRGSAARSRALETLGLVGLGERANHRPVELSGGEQQRVAIARALVNRPSLVLADEPTGNLDSERTDEILALLGDAYREGQTFILVTHDAEVAAACHRVIRMRDGRVHEETVASTQLQPASPAGLGETVEVTPGSVAVLA